MGTTRTVKTFGTVRTMTRVTMLCLALGSAAAMAQSGTEAAPPANPAIPSGPIHSVDSDISVGNALQAQIDLGLGEVIVHGEDVDRIYVRLQLFCDSGDLEKCQRNAEGVAVVGITDGDKLSIRVKATQERFLRRLKIRMEVRVPKNLPLTVHLLEGQIRVDDMLGSTSAEVNRGTIDVNMAASDVGELVLRAGGRATVEFGGETLEAKGLLQGELRWTRPGKIAKIDAKAANGDVRVVLR